MIGQVSPTDVHHAKVEVALGHDQRADAAAAAVLRRLLEVVRDNLEGAIAGTDPEHLHQLRIAVRRSRTVLRQFKRVFPALELPGFRSELRWLQRATGDARDLDVYVEDFDDLAALLEKRLRGDLEPLQLVLARRRVAARARLEQTLRSERLNDLFEDWERLLESLVELPLDERPDAQRSIGSLTGERVVKLYDRILAMGRQIDADSPAESYHELRKKGKELRYLLDLFAIRTFDADVVSPFLRSLKELQDLLGRHQDREVQTTMLRGLSDEVAALPGGPTACVTMGVLLERLAADERAARAEFAERFAALAAPDRRVLVASVFG